MHPIMRFCCIILFIGFLPLIVHAQESLLEAPQAETSDAPLENNNDATINSADSFDQEEEPTEEFFEKGNEDSFSNSQNFDEPEVSEYEQKISEYIANIREEDYTSTVKLQALNKITARTHQMEVKLGEISKFGNLEITLNRCWRAPQTQIPESKALLSIQEKVPGEEVKTVFEGWMFASSPSLSALEHPVYDVRVLECIADKTIVPSN